MFYDWLAEESGIVGLTKSQIKECCFKVFYDRYRTPQFYRRYASFVSRDGEDHEWMREPVAAIAETILRAPEAANAMRLAKRKRPGLEKWYAGLCQDMQRLESEIMIRDVGGVLMRDHPHIPVIPIHDAILTTPRYAETVSEIMRTAYRRKGANPTVRMTPPSTGYVAAA